MDQMFDLRLANKIKEAVYPRRIRIQGIANRICAYKRCSVYSINDILY